jgi:hypothetical protein
VAGDRQAPVRLVRALTFAVLALVLLFGLRAKSDGARPALWVITLSLVVVTLLALPLTSRERKLPIVFGGLVAAQLLLHVGYLFASTGQFAHSGSGGLFCSPAASPGSVPCLPTERGGTALLGVQLIVAALFACWMRGVDSVVWRLARQSVAALIATLAAFASTLFEALLLPAPAVAVFIAAHDAPTRPRSLLFVRACRRRGPPRTLHSGRPLDSATSSAPRPLVFAF